MAEGHQTRPLTTPQRREGVGVGFRQPPGLDIVLKTIADHLAFTHHANGHEDHDGGDDRKGHVPKVLQGGHRQHRGESVEQHVTSHSHDETGRRSQDPHKPAA